jgi:hypothetical protein
MKKWLWAAPAPLGLLTWMVAAGVLAIPTEAEPLSVAGYAFIGGTTAAALLNLLAGQFDPPPTVARQPALEAGRRLCQFILALALALSAVTAGLGAASSDHWTFYVPTLAGGLAVGGLLVGVLIARA